MKGYLRMSEKKEELKALIKADNNAFLKGFDVEARVEGSRESKIIYNWHSPDELKNIFNECLNDSNKLLDYARKIENKDFGISCDIYRQLIVNIESIFDYFCHSIIKYGFLKIYNNEREKTEKYYHFQISLKDVEEIINNNSEFSEALFLKAVDNKMKGYTLMKYSEIKDNFNYIDPQLFLEAAKIFAKKKNDNDNLKVIRLFLDELYHRRNTIVHQNDRDYATGKKYKISYLDVLSYTNRLKEIVFSICEALKNKSNSCY